MKPTRGSTARLVSRENPPQAHRAVGHHDDPYRAIARPPQPTQCPTCRALFADGRWTWTRPTEKVLEQNCPACQRIRDKFPAGYVTIKGAFLAAHRDEIIALVTAKEGSAKAEYPLQRIMAIEDVHGGIQVTTTDSQLARGIGEALQEAYNGDLKVRYSADENLLRATWKR